MLNNSLPHKNAFVVTVDGVAYQMLANDTITCDFSWRSTQYTMRIANCGGKADVALVSTLGPERCPDALVTAVELYMRSGNYAGLNLNEFLDKVM